MARSGVLGADNVLASEIWLDGDDAPDQVRAAEAAGEISAEEASILNKLARDGYAIFPSGADEEVIDAAVRDATSLWTARPHDLLAAAPQFNGGRPMPMAALPANVNVGPAHRLLDAHSHSPALVRLITLPKLHRVIELALRMPIVATQSLYFSYGSTQNLHRDPWYVITNPVSHLYAAWIALEDITDESGPLTYVPGSHKLPYEPLNTGDIIFHDPAATQESRTRHMEVMQRDIEARGLKVHRFLAKRGEVLIWHGSLVHGGSVVKDPTRTRHSFVVHYDAVATHPSQAQTLSFGGASRVWRTTEKLNEEGRLYFANPCAGRTPEEMMVGGSVG